LDISIPGMHASTEACRLTLTPDNSGVSSQATLGTGARKTPYSSLLAHPS
jgi:hypothetical protein